MQARHGPQCVHVYTSNYITSFVPAIPGAARRDDINDESGSESSDLAAELMFDYLSGAAWKQLLCGS